jgi:hypothetical protein
LASQKTCPGRDNCEIVSGCLPSLATVTKLVAVWPTVTAPKETVLGETWIDAAA